MLRSNTKKQNLSKLIETMDEEFCYLMYSAGNYTADGYSKSQKLSIRRTGKTPKEAVTKLKKALSTEYIRTNV